MSNIVDGRELLADMLADDTPFTATPTHSPTLAFSIKKYVLQLMLDRVYPVVPTRDPMEVLKCFQIEVRHPDQLRIIATDMELSMIATTALVAVTTPGTAVIDARKLVDIVKHADDGEVTIRVTNGTARITIGRTTWAQKLKGGEDYPELPETTDVMLSTINRTTFAAALHAVRYAARDATRASLALIDVRAGRLTACDGARFQQATMGTFPIDFQLPIGAVDTLLKLLTKVDVTDISIGQSNNHLIFRVGTDVFVANKLLAQVPDMESTLLRPALANRHPLTLDRADLLTAVRRVRINADTETSAIALRLAPGALTVSSRDKYGNEAAETIDAGWTGTDRVVVVNHVFLTELIAGTNPVLHFTLGDDTKTRKSPLLLRDDTAGTIGVVQQMHSEWVGQ
jgi:DNA polymerase-3 subunit beta